MGFLSAPDPKAVLERQGVPAWKWGVVWAMFLATMLNYMDRQTMGSTAKFIKDEFKLGEEGYGKLEFYFGITFTFMQLVAGALADRVNLKWLYAIALVVWSAAGFATGIVETVTALYFCRMMLGMGESFNWVCAGGVVQRIIPRESRSLANAIFHGGTSVGAALTPLLALLIVGPKGENWRLLFQVVGAAGVIWVVIWFLLLRGNRGKEISGASVQSGTPVVASERISIFKIMTYRTFIVTLLVGLGINVIWHFYRLWLPRVLDRERGMTHAELQYSLAIFFVAADIGGILVGWFTRRMIAGGMAVERARQLVLFAMAGLCLLSGPSTQVTNPVLAMLMFCLVGVGALGSFTCYFAMSQEISGPHTSRCLGMLGAIIWLILSFMQWGVGALVDRLGSFEYILWAVGFVPLLGAFICLAWPKHNVTGHSETAAH